MQNSNTLTQMPEPVKVNVVSYGGVKPGLLVVGNGADGTKTTLFDAATATNGSYMFYQRSSLTSWNVNLPKLENGTDMFNSCARLASWNVDLPKLENGNQMFNGCAALTSWNVTLPELTNGNRMFYYCIYLASWNGALPKLENGTDMFGNTSLASWNVDLPNLTNGRNMFRNCARLASWNVALPNLTNGTDMFDGCSLMAESVTLILNSIPDRSAAGLAVATLTIGKRTNFKTDPDVKELLGETGAEITAKTYSFKGWNVIVQN